MRQVHLGKPPWQRQNSCVVGLQHSTGRHCSNTGPACPPGHPPVRPGEVEAGNGGESVSPGLRRRDSGGRGRPAAVKYRRWGGHGAPPAAEQRPRAPQRPHGANAGRPQPRCPRRPRTPTRRSRGGARSPRTPLRFRTRAACPGRSVMTSLAGDGASPQQRTAAHAPSLWRRRRARAVAIEQHRSGGRCVETRGVSGFPRTAFSRLIPRCW